MAKKMQFTPASKPLMTILNDIENVINGGLDLQPKYQRGYVWSNEFKYKLIYSLIKGYPIGSISLRELNERNIKGASTEVVDGQQRLTTLKDFINNDLIIKGEFSYRIVSELKETIQLICNDDPQGKKLINKLNNKKSFSLKFKDLPIAIQRTLLSYPLATISISNSDENEITEYFNFLQNQEILRAGEIINSIPQTILEKYLLELKDKEALLNILGFSDTRKEFEKLFYSIIGLFDKAINFGTTDKEIQNYVANKKNDLESNALLKTKKMIENLNLIINLNIGKTFNANKRFIKLLLLLAGFNYIDFTENLLVKLKKLDKINNMLSSFNSAQKGIVEKTFEGFKDFEVEEYRLIALFTKGAQTYNNAKSRCKDLADKINFDPKIIVD